MIQEKIAEQNTTERHEQIMGAIAHGWCHKENASKTMDTELAMAITEEIETLLRTDEHPKLGCATTGMLIEELFARLNIDLNYRTIDY